MSNKTILRVSLIALYLGWLILPVWAFFDTRGGLSLLSGLDAHATLSILFPLIGLYAFTFVTWQILVATNLRWLMKLWPHIINFHRYQGCFALALAIVHPLSILIAFGLTTYLERTFVAPALKVYLLPAYLGLTLLITTVVSASLAWYGANLPWWRQLHRLNYLVFTLFWVHSWFIGTDTRLFPLNIIWVTAPILVTLSFGMRYKDAFLRWLETK